MVHLGFYILDLHHIVSGSCSSHSVHISVASALKAFLIPIKHCPCLITQTKPINIPDRKDRVICFSIPLIIPLSFFFRLCSLIHCLSTFLVLFSKRKGSEPSKCINILFFSLFFFSTLTQLSVLESVEGASHSAAVSWPVSSLSNAVVNGAKSR